MKGHLISLLQIKSSSLETGEADRCCAVAGIHIENVIAPFCFCIGYKMGFVCNVQVFVSMYEMCPR